MLGIFSLNIISAFYGDIALLVLFGESGMILFLKIVVFLIKEL